MRKENSMPIVNGKYKNPGWANGQRPPVNAQNLNDISDTLERMDAGGGGVSTLVTLTAAGWSNKTQSVSVPGVSANEAAQLITPVPAIASQSAYYDAGIRATGQAANSLTFTADTVPTANLSVYVVVQGVN